MKRSSRDSLQQRERNKAEYNDTGYIEYKRGRYKGGVGVGLGVGFSGAFVAAGDGTPSGRLRVGSGNAGGLRFALVFVFSLVFATGLTSSIGGGESSTLGAGVAFTLATGLVLPPAGIPSSPFPVGDAPGCTG